ncbi:putative signaling protein [Tepidimonas alkaliphilus]|uniref:Putative signaling protein n=1 Tax=Tepidimonas alkaliphilus TaxID=2588942 RepID=A0A554W7T1_9BURK|nr:EAL domain-containing protein [Tepidimonas alkaliphilus]TSE19637.1 putative signaling protein [Tepidimonas alkaliphilus]
MTTKEPTLIDGSCAEWAVHPRLREALAEGGLGMANQELGQKLLAAAPDAVLLVDGQGTIVLANAAAQALTGYDPQALVGRSLDVLLPPEVAARHRVWVQQFFRHPCARPMGRVPHLRLRHRRGHEVPVDVALNVCEVAGAACAVVFVRDATQSRRMAELLHHQATHDALTGLFNRAQLHEWLELTARQAQRAQRRGAVLLIDLDDFKAINDGYGHHAGDRVLIEVARRLRRHVRAADVVARLGGDEFVVVLSDVSDPQAALAVGDKLLRALTEPVELEAVEVAVGASIGVALFPDDAQAAEALLRAADLAMYAAKEGGRRGVARYEPSMGDALDQRVRLQQRLQQALRRGGLTLHYQPQMEVADGRVHVVEALLRWHDAELGAVPPQRCIAAAEASGLIVALGDWVLDEACRQARCWRDQGADLRVAVNLSAQQFRLPDLPQRVQATLQRHALEGAALELEITESQAMNNPAQACAKLQQLVSLGVVIALDDFGTGHSSLAQLKRLPLHRIKIDRDFVRGVTHDAMDDAVVRGVAQLARLLQLQTVAEGVETEEQRGHVIRCGVTSIQGWWLAPALPAEELGRWLQDRAGEPCLPRSAAPATRPT